MQRIDVILHTATLHKPHVGTHSQQAFIDTNIAGTLNLLQSAVRCGVQAFVYTSTTSTFGDAMTAEAGGPAVWVSESLRAVPKNIYGVTKCAAEDLCQLFHRNQGLPCIVLKTSRFFPEQDDSKQARSQFDDTNLKVNELLFRRIDIADVVQAHLHAMDRCRMLGFDRFIISATTPFKPADSLALATDAAKVVAQYVPEFVATYEQLGWKMFPVIGRVYDNAHARDRLQWEPKYDFRYAIDRLRARLDYRSDLTLKIGRKGYHDKTFTEGPYPLDN